MGRHVRFGQVVVLALLGAALVCGGCSNTTTQPVVVDNPRLVVSPDTLDIDDSSPTASAYLSTDAPGTLIWRVTGKPPWVTVVPESGQVTQTLGSVTIAASAQGLNPGMFGGTVVFHSSGGEERVFVRFAVATHPNGTASVSSLHFAQAEDQKSFTLTNQGTGLLIWSVASSETWLNLVPTSGYLDQGQSATLYASVVRSGLAAGTSSASLTVTSNSEGGAIQIPVTMDVPSMPELQTSSDTLRFNYFVNSNSFKLWNSGNVPVTWTASASQPFLQLAPSSGAVAPGETTTVVVTADRTSLATGIYPGAITVIAPALPARTVPVVLRNFVETKWALGFTISDADYDRAHNRIVAVGGGSSPRLFVIDPETQAQTSVALPLPASCVSVRPDGLYAAAGHDGYVSYVDLTSMSVAQTFAVTSNTIDVVLPSNGWIYVFPRTDQWVTFHSIEIATGQETVGGGTIRAGTLVRLHPSGNYIYGANNGLSPSDIEKYDIRPGAAAYMYDSPYHGDYPFSGNLWITDDGQRIIARSGNVFRSTTSQVDDMTYNGNLAGSQLLEWAEHSSAAGRIFCLLADGFQAPAPSELRIYNTSFLAFLGVQPLPPFLVPDGSGGGTIYASKGRFAFTNAAGTRVYVLVKAAPGSGLLNDWAGVSFDVSALP